MPIIPAKKTANMTPTRPSWRLTLYGILNQEELRCFHDIQRVYLLPRPSFQITVNTSPGGVRRLRLPIERRNAKSKINMVQQYTAEVARAMPMLCHKRANT